MFQLPDISFADIRLPTDEEEELGRGFRTLSNYVEAWSIYLKDEAGSEPKCPLKSKAAAQSIQASEFRTEVSTVRPRRSHYHGRQRCS